MIRQRTFTDRAGTSGRRADCDALLRPPAPALRGRERVPNTGIAMALGLLLLVAMALAGCSRDPSSAVIATGVSGPTDPGLASYSQQCASCHGSRGGGGLGPALPGHTAEQIVRQVRAPVGEMPMFAPSELGDTALAALTDYLLGLPVGDDGGHDDHDHGVGLLAAAERVQLRHALLLDSLDGGDMDDAIHWAEHAVEGLTRSHLAAMEGVVADLRAGDAETALEVVGPMVTDDTSTRGFDRHELMLWLAMDAAEMDDHATVQHHLGHLHDEGVDVAALMAAADADDMARVHELAAAMLGLEAEPHGHEDPHDEADPHEHDDPAEAEEPHGHEVPDEAVEPHTHEDEPGHHGEEVPGTDEGHDESTATEEDAGTSEDDEVGHDDATDPTPEPTPDHEHAEDSEPHDH